MDIGRGTLSVLRAGRRKAGTGGREGDPGAGIVMTQHADGTVAHRCAIAVDGIILNAWRFRLLVLDTMIAGMRLGVMLARKEGRERQSQGNQRDNDKARQRGRAIAPFQIVPMSSQCRSHWASSISPPA